MAGGLTGPLGATYNGLGTVGTAESTKAGVYRDGNGNWVQNTGGGKGVAPGTLKTTRGMAGSYKGGLSSPGAGNLSGLAAALGLGGGGGGAALATPGGGGGNVVAPPGTPGNGGGAPQGGGNNFVNGNYSQAANPYLTAMLPQYQQYQQRLDSLYNETPEDMMGKLRANLSLQKNEDAANAAARGGMGQTNSAIATRAMRDNETLSNAALAWKNASLQNKQAAAGLMGSGLAGASGVAGNIAGNQVQMMQQQLGQNQLNFDAAYKQQELDIERMKAQQAGVLGLLSTISRLV